MEWAEARALILAEPKVPLRCTAVRSDPAGQITAEVCHDGHQSWRIQGESKLEVNDGRRAVISKNNKAEAYRAVDVYSFGWIKSMVHPRLMNFGDEDFVFRGLISPGPSQNDREMIQMSVEGLDESLPQLPFDLSIDKLTGLVMEVRHPDLAAAYGRLESVEWDPQFMSSTFAWTGPIDLDHM